MSFLIRDGCYWITNIGPEHSGGCSWTDNREAARRFERASAEAGAAQLHGGWGELTVECRACGGDGAPPANSEALISLGASEHLDGACEVCGRAFEPMVPKYPEISVQLTGKDGNAYAILATILRAMRKAGISKEDRKSFESEATSGDYDNLLAAAMRWVEVK